MRSSYEQLVLLNVITVLCSISFGVHISTLSAFHRNFVASSLAAALVCVQVFSINYYSNMIALNFVSLF